MTYRRTFWASAAAIAVAGLVVAPARAVVVDGNTANYSGVNLTAPAGFSTFNNVGAVNSASGVYLGSGWVITASHVGAGTFQLPAYSGTTTYSVVSGSVHQLENTDHSAVDLTMFKINNAPALPSLTIGTSAPAVNTLMYLAGNGLNRKDLPGDSSDKVYYTATPSTGGHYVWTQSTSASYNVYGYQIDTTARAVRWGQALTIDADPFTSGSQTTYTDPDGDGHGIQPTFTTLFQDASGIANGINGDSGGGMFDSSNVLRGIIITIGTYVDQPSNTLMFGNETNAVDLSVYRNQINSIMGVPEPAMLGFLGFSGLLVLRRKRR